jgi:hypothetical protein
MAAAPGKDDFVRLEKEYWDSIRKRDSKRAVNLTDETSVLVGPEGIAELHRDALGPLIENPPYELLDFELDEKNAHVRMLGDDVAIVAYPVKEDMRFGGKDLHLEAYDSTVWVRRGENWVAALHTETIAGAGLPESAPTR